MPFIYILPHLHTSNQNNLLLHSLNRLFKPVSFYLIALFPSDIYGRVFMVFFTSYLQCNNFQIHALQGIQSFG